MTEPTSPRLSRRALLRSGFAGLGLVVLAGTGIAVQGTKLRRAPSRPLRVLTLAEYSIVAAIADRVCPSPRPGVPGATAVDVGSLVDAALVTAHDDAKQGVKLGLRIVESGLTGALFGERVRPFTALSGEDQDATLLRFRDSRVAIRRTLFKALTGLCAALYYGDERTWAGVGYPGPPSPEGLRTAYAGQLVDLDALLAPAGGTR